MVSSGFNFTFLENRQKHITDNKAAITAEVQALTNLMNLTGVCRLFDRKDIYELVKRTQLIFPERNMIQDFFDNDLLLEFPFENEIHKLDLFDLIIFIGYEAIDLNKNHSAFENWAVNISQYKSNAAIIAKAVGTLNLDTSRSNISGVKDNIVIDFSCLPDDIPFNHEDVMKAENFAESVVKMIPSNAFDRLKFRFPNKFKELELRNAPFQEPIFDFKSFAKEKQKRLWSHFFPDMEYFDYAPTREYHELLINLAWLWANGFVIDENINSVHFDFRIKNFKQEDLETEDNSNDLLSIHMLYNLDEIFPILLDPEISKLAERPWEKLNIYAEK